MSIMRSLRIPALNKSDYGVCDNKKDKKDKENKKRQNGHLR